MSIIPLLYDLTDLDSYYPRRSQYNPFAFGINATDIIHPSFELFANHRNRDADVHRHLQNLLNRKNAGVKESVGKDGFQVSMDVQQFNPNELNVKTVDNWVVVEGQHEEKADDHGLISRHFVRKYQLPQGYDPSQVVTTLSSDGVLTVKAPPPNKSANGNERVIQIQQTGPAHLTVKENPKDDNQTTGTNGNVAEK